VAELFASGRAADLALGLLALEAVALVLLLRRRGQGAALPGLLLFLAAGACLLLALRAALVGAAWVWVALPLLGALAAHLAELRLRLRRG
jgi:hypothetical protein